MINETLKRVNNAPGLCSLTEITDAKIWLEGFKENLAVFRTIYGAEPLGFTVDSKISSLEWYQDFKKRSIKGAERLPLL